MGKSSRQRRKMKSAIKRPPNKQALICHGCYRPTAPNALLVNGYCVPCWETKVEAEDP